MAVKRKTPFEVLKENKKPLSKRERDKVMKAKAVWHHGPHGEETAAIWKSKDSKGKVTFVANTHRAMDKSPNLDVMIRKFHKTIKGTAG